MGLTAAEDRFLTRIWDRRHALDWRVVGFTRTLSDWRFRGRVLDEHLLYLVVRDHFLLRVGAGEDTLGPGGLLWLPPGTRHDFALPAGADGLTVYHFRFHLAGDPGDCPAAPLLLPEQGHLQPLAQALWEEGRLGLPGTAARRRALLIALLTAVLRERSSDATAGGFGTAQRRQLLSWVEAHIHERPTPADLAGVLGLSEDYCSRRFRATFGCAPRTWLMRERIRHAATTLLTTEQPIAAIAEQYGYDGPFLFSRQFRQVMGHSPSDHRRRHLGVRRL